MKKIVIDLVKITLLFAGIGAAVTIGLNQLNGSTSSVAFGIVCLVLSFFGVLIVLPSVLGAIVSDWKTYRNFFLVLVMTLFFSGCAACTRIDPGHVGIVINLYGSDRGVSESTLRTGMVWYNPFTEAVFEYPTYVQTAVWSASTTEGKPINEQISFTTGDQMQVFADISLSYHLRAEKVPAFYVKFRSDKLDAFTHGFLRNMARDKFDSIGGKYRIEQIMGDNAQFLKDVRTALQTEIAGIGVEIDQFGFIGAPRPPAPVVAAINAKVEAVQKAIQSENELRRTEAEAKKKVAEAEGEAKSILVKAKAQADANELLAKSLTPTLVQYNAVMQWDGKRPMVEGSSGGLLLQLPRVDSK